MEIKTSLLSYDVTDSIARRPGHQMGLMAVASCAATGLTHRYDVNTTVPTLASTLEMELSRRIVLVEIEVGRNTTSGTSATPSTSGRTGNANSTIPRQSDFERQFSVAVDADASDIAIGAYLVSNSL